MRTVDIGYLLYYALQGSMQYKVIGDMPAPSFFDINQNTGRIVVKTNLKLDDGMEYKVSNCNKI